jgi:hypothetical protein
MLDAFLDRMIRQGIILIFEIFEEATATDYLTAHWG